MIERGNNLQNRMPVSTRKRLFEDFCVVWPGVEQTAPWISASTSILQGHQHTAKVQDILHANKLRRLQRAHCELGLTFARDIHEPLFPTLSDASRANRADLSLQGGTITFLTGRRVLDGQKAPFSLVSWHSRKLKRIARSSTSAEIQSCGNGVDENEFIRQLWFEIHHREGITAKTSDDSVSKIGGCIVCDAKNMFDSVTRILSSGLQLEERRLCLDVLSIRESCERTKTGFKWVDSDQMFGDDLTKLFSVDKLIQLLKRCCIGISFDPDFVSAKKKRMMRTKNQLSWKQKEIESHVEFVMASIPTHVSISPPMHGLAQTGLCADAMK